MFRLYSRGCEYAIRALMYIPPVGSNDRLTAKKVCKKAKIPESFTRKVFQALVNGGFLEAAPGPRGGYSLAHDPKEISLLEIIQAVDGADTFAACIMGLPECDAKKPCPLHDTWSKAKEELIRKLDSRTLEDLVKAEKLRPSRARPRRRR